MTMLLADLTKSSPRQPRATRIPSAIPSCWETVPPTNALPVGCHSKLPDNAELVKFTKNLRVRMTELLMLLD
jgi:hypothetical protein